MEHTTPKALDKSFSSVTELLKDSGVENELLDAVQDVRLQQVANALAKMRVAKGLTQKQMATVIGCTQGRISKLETGRDEDLTLKDLLDYARTTGTAFQIAFGPKMTLADQIKFHVCALRPLLDELLKIAKDGDDGIIAGIKSFLDKMIFDLGSIIGHCMLSLPKTQSSDTPEIEVISATEIRALKGGKASNNYAVCT